MRAPPTTQRNASGAQSEGRDPVGYPGLLATYAVISRIGAGAPDEGRAYRRVLCARAVGVRVRGLRVLGRGEAATSENAFYSGLR
jgi:hypothetical protein